MPAPVTSRSRTNLARLNKPQLHRRITPTTTATSGNKGAHSRKASKDEVLAHPVDDLDDDDFDGISFHQYCSVCDKHLPSSSTLYCSDKCSLLDSHNTSSLPLFKKDITPPVSPSAAYYSSEVQLPLGRDIIPQHSPSQRYSASYYDHQRSPSDPDENVTRPSGYSTTYSEGDRYLAQQPLPDRSRYARAASTSSVYAEQHIAAGPPTPNGTAPIRRPNPRWSSTSFSARSVDLVMPVSVLPTDAPQSSLVTRADKKQSSGTSNYLLSVSVGHNPRSSAAALPKKSKHTNSPPLEIGTAAYERRPQMGAAATKTPGRGTLKQMFQFGNARATPSGTPGGRDG